MNPSHSVDAPAFVAGDLIDQLSNVINLESIPSIPRKEQVKPVTLDPVENPKTAKCKCYQSPFHPISSL